jgi:S-adenosylmethionine synthetase
MQSEFVFTSESVTRGHPDKLCDQISDAIVGHYLRRDAFARVVAECAVSTGIVFLSLKLRSSAVVNVSEIARQVIREAGYVDDETFRAESCTILTSVRERNGLRAPSRDDETSVAEDQATVFGFACDHTPELMPLPIVLSHRLARRLDEARANETLDFLAPDAKTQVGVEFSNRRPSRVHGITLVAAQRRESEPGLERLRRDLLEHVIERTFAEMEIRPDARTHVAINPEGPVEGGGPEVHAGLTGRKTAVDSYGEYARHGGAALSGKDPSRIDRVGAYAARHAAKNVVAAGLATQCEVQLSYSIGLAEPVSVNVETYGTGRIDENEIARRIRRVFDFRLASIVRNFELRTLPSHHEDGFYRRLAVYGHVGRTDIDLPWERLDRADELRD